MDQQLSIITTTFSNMCTDLAFTVLKCCCTVYVVVVVDLPANIPLAKCVCVCFCFPAFFVFVMIKCDSSLFLVHPFWRRVSYLVSKFV